MIVILLMTWGYSDGGWNGLLACVFFGGILLAFFPPVAREEPTRGDSELMSGDQVHQNVRKGKRVNPTRPTEDDYAAMIVNNYERRKGN